MEGEEMKPLGIGHDYAHCKCVRYLLHLEAVEQGLTYVTYVVPNRRGEVCEYYWKCKEENK